MDADDKLVELLKGAYAKELKAYHGYLHAYVTVTGPLQTVYGEIYESFMEREMHHLEELGKKIVAMGGMPPIEYPSIAPVAEAIFKGYDETLTVLQQAEVETLEMYKEIHKAADAAGDLPLVLLIEEIMQEEEEHHDELERILLDVPKENNVEMHDELAVDAIDARAIRAYKLAQLMRDPEQTAQAISVIVDTLATYVDPLSAPNFKSSVRENIAKINAGDLAGKRMKGGALVGQAVNLVKAVLRGQEPNFVANTLNRVLGKL